MPTDSTHTGASTIILTSTSNSYSGPTAIGANVIMPVSDSKVLGSNSGNLTFRGGSVVLTADVNFGPPVFNANNTTTAYTPYDPYMTHHYSFNDGTANDSVGQANGTLVNATIVNGQAVFNGAGIGGSRITLPVSGSDDTIAINIAGHTSNSFVMWFNPSALADYSRFLGFGSDAAAPGDANVWAIYESANGNVVNRFWNAGYQNAPSVVGQPYMLVVNFTGQNESAYLVGAGGVATIVENFATTAAAWPTVWQGAAWIGGVPFSNPSLNGTVDDYRIYSTNVSTADFVGLFAAGPDGTGNTVSMANFARSLAVGPEGGVLDIGVAHSAVGIGGIIDQGNLAGTLHLIGTGTLGLLGNSNANLSIPAGIQIAVGDNNHTGAFAAGSVTFGDQMTIAHAGVSAVWGANLSGNGTISHTGTGTTTLSGINTFTGGLNILAGKVIFNNLTGEGLGTGTVTVASGATLGGKGYSSAPIVIQTGGTLTPGNGAAVGTMHVSNLTLETNAEVAFDLRNFGAGQYDVLDLSGSSLTLGSTLNIELFNAGGNTAYQFNGDYTLFTGVTNNFISGSVTFTGGSSSGGSSPLNLINYVPTATYTFSQPVGNIIKLNISGGVNYGNWVADANATWGETANWTSGAIANAAGSAANFGAFLTNARTITLSAPVIVSQLYLAGTNSYTFVGSPFTFNPGPAGPTVLTVSGSHTIATDIEAQADIAITQSGRGVLDFSGNLNAGSHGLIITAGTASGGTVLLSGATQTYGNAAISGGVLQIGAGGTLGSFGSGSILLGTGTVTAGTLTVNRSDSFTMYNGVSGYGAFNKAGAGTVTIATAMTITGSANISAGAVILNAEEALGYVNLRLSAGKLDLGGHMQSISGLSLPAGTAIVNTSPSAATLNLFQASGATLAGNITSPGGGDLNINKSGGGNLTFTSTATSFTGVVNITGGQVILNETMPIMIGSTLILGAGQPQALQFAAGGSLTLLSSVVVGTGQGISSLMSITSANASVTFAGNLTMDDTHGYNASLLRPNPGVSANSMDRTLTMTGVITIPNGDGSIFPVGGVIADNVSGNVILSGNGQVNDLATGQPYSIGPVVSSGLTVNYTVNQNASILTGTPAGQVGLTMGGASANAAQSFTMLGNSIVRVGANGDGLFDINFNGGTVTDNGTLTYANATNNAATTVNIAGGNLQLGAFSRSNTNSAMATVNLLGGTVTFAHGGDILSASSLGTTSSFVAGTSGTGVTFNLNQQTASISKTISGKGSLTIANGILQNSATQSLNFGGVLITGPGAIISASSKDQLGSGTLGFNGGSVRLTGTVDWTSQPSTQSGLSFASAALTHRYNFDDGTANDSVGHANGALSGVAVISNGQAVFNGAANLGARINMPISSTDDVNALALSKYAGTGISFVAWYTDTGATGYTKTFLASGSTAPVGQDFWYFLMAETENGANTGPQITNNSYNTGGAGQVNVFVAKPSQNELHQAVVTLDSSVMTFYLDGVNRGSVGVTAVNVPAVFTGSAYIGSGSYSGDPSMNGKVDDFQIFNGKLTIDDITALYVAGSDAAIKSTPSASVYNFQVNSGGGTLDLGSGNNVAGLTSFIDVGNTLTGYGTLAIVGSGSVSFIGTSNANLALSSLASLVMAPTTSAIIGGVVTSSGQISVMGGRLTGGTIGNNGVFNYNHTDASAIASALDGSGAFNFIGTSTTTLTGSNTLTGVINLNAGSLIVGSGTNGSLGSGNVVMAAGTSLVFNRSGVLNVPGNITGTGTVTVSQLGSGTTVLSGSNNFFGGILLAGGDLQIASANALPGSSGSALAFSGGALYYDNTYTADLSGRFSNKSGQRYAVEVGANTSIVFNSALASNGGTFQKLGLGTLTFNAANSYGGATSVAGGTLREGVNNAIPAGSPITVDGSTSVLDLNGHVQGDSSVQVTVSNGGMVIGGTLNASTYAVNSGTITSTLLNGGTIVKKTDGTVLIGGNNSAFTGNITLSKGTLTAGNANALGSNVPGAAGSITFSGGYLQYGPGLTSVSNVDFSGRFMNAGSQRFYIDTNGNNVTFNTALQAGANSSFNKVGAGTLVLTKASIFNNNGTLSAGTLIGTVTGGTLKYGTANALTTGVVVVNGPAILDMNGFNQTAANGLVVDGGGTITSLNGASMFTLTAGVTNSFEAKNGVIDVVLGGNNVVFNKTTNGTVLLTKSNVYSGTTTLSAGMLQLGNASALGTSAVVVTGGSVTGGILNLVNFTPTFGTLSLTGGTLTGGTVTTNNNLNLLNGVINSVLGGSAALTFFNSTSSTAASTVTLNGANTLSGAITIGAGSLTGGVLVLGSPTALGSGTGNVTFATGTISDFIRYGTGITTDLSPKISTATSQNIGIDTNGNNVTFNTSLVLNGGTTSTAILTKTGLGSLVLNASNSGVASVVLNSGTLTSGTLAVRSAGALTGATVRVDNGVLDTGTLNISGVSTLTLGFVNPGTITGTGTFASSAPTFELNSGAVNVSLTNTSNGITGLNKIAAGTLTLNSTSNYNGGTTVTIGVLALGVNNALPTAANGTLSIGGVGVGAVLDLANHFATVGSVTLGSGTLGIAGSAGTLTSNTGFALGSPNATSNSIINTVLAGTANTVPLNIVNNLGTVTLNGINTYTGKSIISNGSVIVNNTSSLGNGGAIVMTGGWLVYGTNIAPTGGVAPDFSNRFSITDNDQKFNIDTNGNAVTFNSPLVTISPGNTSGIDKRGAGTLVLNSAASNNFYFTTVEGGVLQVGTGGSTGSVGTVIALHGNGVLAYNRSNSITLSATITGDGTGGLTQMGSGILNLTATSSFTGVTSVLNGTLREGTGTSSSVLAASSSLYVAGGTFDLNGHTQTLAGVTLTAGSIRDTATTKGTLTSATPFVTGDGTVDAYLNGSSGTVGLTQSGTGNTVLMQQNLYRGPTSITAGTLTMGTANAIYFNGTSPSVGFVSLGANNGTLTGTGVLALNTSGTITHNLSLGSLTLYAGSITGTGSTITNNGTSAYNFYGGEVGVSLAGSSGILKNAGTVSSNYGVLTLAADNSSLSGTTTLSGGTVILGNANALGSTTINYSGTNSTTIAYAPYITTDISSKFVVGSGLSNIIIGVNIADTGTNSAVTFNTPLPQSGTTTLTKVGAGTLVLGTVNSFTGTTTIRGGTLLVGVNDALASGTLAISSGVLDLSSRNLTKPGLVFLGTTSVSGSITNITYGTITSAGGVLNSSLGFDLVAGVINAPLVGTSNATINKHGAANVIVTSDLSGFLGNIAYSLSAGTITVGTGGTTGVLPNTLISTGTSAAYLTFNRSDAITYGGTLTGNLALTQAGTGTLTLTQLNTNSGGTNLNSGLLVIGASNALGTGVIAFNGGALKLYDGFDYSPWFSSADNQAYNINLNNQAVIFHAPVVSAGGTLNLSGGGSVTFMSDNSTYGQLNIPSGVTVLLGGGSTLGLTGSLGAASVSDNGLIAFNRTTPLTVATAITGTGGIEQREAGVTTLTGLNTYAGTTTITKGTLTVGDGTTNGQLGSGAIVNNSSLILNRSDAMTIGGPVTGTGALTKAGADNATLTGAANYSGPTTISAGTLTYGGGVNHTIGTVSGGGTLKVAASTKLNTKALTNVSLSSSGTLTIASNSGVSVLNSVDVSGGLLDVKNNDLLVHNGSNVQNLIKAGASGNWSTTTNAITSSSAKASLSSSNKYGLAYATGTAYQAVATPARTTFDSQPIVATDEVVMVTLLGDLNMDGKVNLLDATKFLQNLYGTNKTWTQGDFNYDGKVNLQDATPLLQNLYKTTATGFPADTGVVPIGVTGSSGGSAPVPEPTSLALLGLGAAALLSRRRRKA